MKTRRFDLNVADAIPPRQIDFVANYIADLRRRAEERRREGLRQAAEQYELVARELEVRQQVHFDEVLSTAQAALESGYSVVQLRRLVRRGEISLRRCDLPRRPGHRARSSDSSEARTLADEVVHAPRTGRTRRAS